MAPRVWHPCDPRQAFTEIVCVDKNSPDDCSNVELDASMQILMYSYVDDLVPSLLKLRPREVQLGWVAFTFAVLDKLLPGSRFFPEK
jgi:hypothetical protein